VRSRLSHFPLAFALCSVAVGTPAALRAQARTDSSITPSGTAVAANEGLASFYAKRRQGRRTASGERFDNKALVAAHPSLPFGTRLRVTNLANGRSVEVRVVDRGPSATRQREGYVIDLSRAAARALSFVRAGRTKVRLEVIEKGSTG
jgi:rare lipoprotein A